MNSAMERQDVISDLIIHGSEGEAIPYDNFLDWVAREKHGIAETHLSWMAGEHRRRLLTGKSLNAVRLPDASGFICFEAARKTDNCYVLDANGKQRYRLTVPWELTGREVPRGAEMWFRNVGQHKDGKFGVTAWIEYAGDYYFELDYQSGQFLWGKEIRF